MKILRQKEYSKFGHALKHIGRGAAIGAGLGGMIGSHSGAKKGSTSYKPALIGAGIGAIIGGTLGVLGHKVDWSISHEAEEYERTHKAEVKEALNSIQIDEIIKRLERFNNTEIYKRLNYINFLRFELEGTEYSEYIDEFGDICSTLIGGYPSVFTIKPKEIKEQVAISLSKNKTYLPLLACAFRDYEGVIIDDNTLVYDWKKKSFGIMDTDWKLVGSLGSFDSAKTRCIKYLKDSKTTPKNVIDKDMYDELIESMDGFYIHDELDFPSYEEVCKVMSGIINKAIDEYIKEVNKI